MADRSLQEYRERNEDVPLDLLRDCAEWKPVIQLIDDWAAEKLDATSGYSPEELDFFSKRQGVRFPPTLREWWRIAGRHPFVIPGLLPDNARFIGPDDQYLFDDNFLLVTLDDHQTWGGNGIHSDFLSEADPRIHGINSTITPKEAPALDWYKSKFIATGLSLPAIIFSTMLSHLFSPNEFVRKGVVHLKIGDDHMSRRLDPEQIIELGLSRFSNPTLIGDIYSDGQDLIYWWWMGVVCRSTEAADRVRRLVPTHPHNG